MFPLARASSHGEACGSHKRFAITQRVLPDGKPNRISKPAATKNQAKLAFPFLSLRRDIAQLLFLPVSLFISDDPFGA